MDNLALRAFSSIDFTAKSQAQRDSHEERLSIPAHTSGCNTPATKNEGMAEGLDAPMIAVHGLMPADFRILETP